VSEKPKEYSFQEPHEGNEYRLFPDELETDDTVYFHGTPLSNLQSILMEGFKPGPVLPSVSYGYTSTTTLEYVRNLPERGCVLAVRFANRPEKSDRGPSIMHVYDVVTQPEVIGYVIVPARSPLG
jgi:hypothetical protein